MDGDRQLIRGIGNEGVGVRLIPATLVFLFMVISGYSWAQDSQIESLTITTYYPAPYGVYKNPRIFPGEKPVALSENQPGTIYFNQTEQKLYIFNGTLNDWERLGSEGSGYSAGSGLKIYSDHHVSPDVCYLPISGFETQLCDCLSGWYKDITFPTPFTQKPEVIVTVERAPDMINSPCAGSGDSVHAAADQITTTGFRILAGSSPDYWASCGHAPDAYEGTRTRAEVGWIAIGK